MIRKYQKKELLKLLDTYQEVYCKLEKQLSAISENHILEIFTDLQDGAIKMGEILDACEEDGKTDKICLQTIRELEQLCELFYVICMEANKTPEEKKAKLNIIKIQTKKIREMIDGISEKWEIVFLPYKVSMWDCMESIWMAAKEDKNCECYVVPIPYYEKDMESGKSFFCYEGSDMPEYVPVTSYRDYDLKTRRPDIIYFHNPYDEWNNVTRVHADYYSRELKKYTDMLVYIPYFFSGRGPVTETHLQLPAYEYMDKIIVQDEEKAESLYPYVPEKKVMIAGSPKIDRLINLQKYRKRIIDEEIPESWKKQINNKKIFLYNVSITGMLGADEKVLKKIRYVISQFKGQNDVVLWWRPHPLIEATLKAMRPQMYQEYMSIKEEFARKRAGILDERPDSTMAAVICDAYIGESSSSLVHYFGILGKPVLYTDWSIISCVGKKQRTFCTLNSFTVEGDSLWFVPSVPGLRNLLYQMDLKTGNMELLAELGLEAESQKFGTAYFGICRADNKIILCPYDASDIYIYDPEERKSVRLPLENCDYIHKFDQVYTEGRKVFFKPRCYPAIVELDLENYKLFYWDQGIRSFRKNSGPEEIFTWACEQVEHKLFLFSNTDNRVLIFDTDTKEYQIQEIGDASSGYKGFGRSAYDGIGFWLADKDSNYIVRWDKDKNAVKKYDLKGKASECSVQEAVSVVGIIAANNNVYIFLNAAGGILMYDEGKDCFLPCSWATAAGKTESLSLVKTLGEKYAAGYSPSVHSIVLFDLCDGSSKYYPCECDEEQLLINESRQQNYELGMKALWEAPVSQRETMKWSVDQFVDYVKNDRFIYADRQKDNYGMFTKHMEGDCGRYIHSSLTGNEKD